MSKLTHFIEERCERCEERCQRCEERCEMKYVMCEKITDTFQKVLKGVKKGVK